MPPLTRNQQAAIQSTSSSSQPRVYPQHGSQIPPQATIPSSNYANPHISPSLSGNHGSYDYSGALSHESNPLTGLNRASQVYPNRQLNHLQDGQSIYVPVPNGNGSMMGVLQPQSTGTGEWQIALYAERICCLTFSYMMTIF